MRYTEKQGKCERNAYTLGWYLRNKITDALYGFGYHI